MKKHRLVFISTLIALSFFLSACGRAITPSSWPGIAVNEAGDTVFIAYNQHVYAVQLENGVERWRFPAQAENSLTFYSTPEITSDGHLLIGSYDNNLYSLNPQNNGNQNWSFEGASNRFIGSPLSTEAGIFAPNADHVLYALDTSGRQLWTYETLEPQWAAPVSDGQTVYLPSMDHHLYALDAKNGNLRWEKDLGGAIVGRPAMGDDGTLYVGSFTREVVAINSSNGVVQWRSSTEGWIWSGPTYHEGRIFAGDIEGYVYAFDSSNGEEIWRVKADGAILGSPLVSNEHVYVGTENGQVQSINLDGRIQWTQNVEGQVYSSPIAAGDFILIGLVEADALLLALDSNGTIQWSFIPQN